MDLKETSDFNSFLNELKESCGGQIKNLELHYLSIQEFNDNKFSEVIDLRSKEDFDFDNIVGSHSLPVLKTGEMNDILQLPTDQRIRLNATLRYIRLTGEDKLDLIKHINDLARH